MAPARIHNSSIIVHVDHGKSSLGDRILCGAIEPSLDGGARGRGELLQM